MLRGELSDMTDDREILSQLGETFSSLEPITIESSPILDPPPVGAGRLAAKTENAFLWKPLSSSEWMSIPPGERGDILVARGIAWLTVNADTKISPIGFLSPRAGSSAGQQLFGLDASTLRKALCWVYGKVHRNETVSDVTVIALGIALYAATGLEASGCSPHVAKMLIVIYGRRLCQ